MNSLNDLLSQKTDKIFTADQPINTPDETNNEEKPTNTDLDYSDLKKTIYQIKDQLDQILRKINKQQGEELKQTEPDTLLTDHGEKIIEGVFNGLLMIGSDGKEYAVPANYASKSKLVEGDLMKLTITNKGTFVYKQIGPIERKRLVGELTFAGDQYMVNVDGKNYSIIAASVSFFKGKPGDEAVILVPQDGNSDWGALENIIHK